MGLQSPKAWQGSIDHLRYILCFKDLLTRVTRVCEKLFVLKFSSFFKIKSIPFKVFIHHDIKDLIL